MLMRRTHVKLKLKTRNFLRRAAKILRRCERETKVVNKKDDKIKPCNYFEISRISTVFNSFKLVAILAILPAVL